MATDKKLTELTFRPTALNQDLIYLVSDDENGDPESLAINVAGLLKGVVTGVNRIISGQVVYTGTGYQFKSIELVYEINGFIYYSHNDTITNDAPDGSNPRLDVIYVDASGMSIKKGTPAVTPVEPSLDNPDSELKTNLILVQNGTTEPPEISVDTMYSENLQESGGEWDTATSSARILLGSTTNPINLTKDIRIEKTALDGDYFSLEHSSPLTISQIQNIRMRFRSLQKWNKDYLQLTFYDGATVVATSFIYSTSFPTNNLVTIYDVYLTNAEILWVSGETQFDKIVFTCTDDGKSTMRVATQLDEIEVQYGGTSTVPNDSIILADKVITDATGFSGNLSSADDTAQKAFATLDALVAGVGDMLLAGVQTITGAKTFEATKLLLRNVADTFSSYFTNTNTAQRIYTLPDKAITVAGLVDITDRATNLIIEFNPDGTDLAIATGLIEFQMPNYATTLTDISVSVSTAPTGSVATFDLNEAGVSVLSTKVTIDATEKTSETAVTAPVISDSSLGANAVMTIDIDGIGSTLAGAGGKMIIYYNKA